jgi:hypothetical protein
VLQWDEKHDSGEEAPADVVGWQPEEEALLRWELQPLLAKT